MIKKTMAVKRTARNKMMNLLARRDHSEAEIKKKLKGEFSADEIAVAIQYGRDHGWLPNSEEGEQRLANQFASHLHRRKKGILYINKALQTKGLPEIQSDSSMELEKALELVKNKYKIHEGMSREEKQKLKGKVGRLLLSRGFEMSIVRKVIYEKR
jgi:regulatory protein